jgi:hypothetical protein
LPGFQSAAARDSPGTTFFNKQAFCADLGGQLRTSGKIATGVREAGNQTGVQWINGVRVDDGNRVGRVHHGKGGGCRDHHNDIDVQSNHLRRKLFEALSLASCIPALDYEIAALVVAVFAQAFEQGVIKTLMSVGDKSHPPNFARVLRPRRERPRRRAAEQRDELAPPHSITSSARASSDGGTSSPGALAVLRSMIGSTFVICWTGKPHCRNATLHGWPKLRRPAQLTSVCLPRAQL